MSSVNLPASLCVAAAGYGAETSQHRGRAAKRDTIDTQETIDKRETIDTQETIDKRETIDKQDPADKGDTADNGGKGDLEYHTGANGNLEKLILDIRIDLAAIFCKSCMRDIHYISLLHLCCSVMQ